MATTYEVGDVYPAVGTFTLDDENDSPDAVELRVQPPTGDPVYHAVTEDEAGVFSRDVPLTEAGNWAFTWVGTGVPTAARSTRIYVAPNLVAPDA
jgi:hypothetical protein